MDIREALKIFEFSEYDDISDSDLKKKFRELALKHHPDSGGDESKFKLINEANKVLKKFIKDMNFFKSLEVQSTAHSAVIGVDDLINLYKGKEITLKDGYKLNSGNLKSNRVYIDVSSDIEIFGIKTSKNQVVKYRLDDNYEVTYTVTDSDIYSEREVSIILNGKKISTKMVRPKMRITFNFDNLVKVYVQIERVLPDTSDNS